MPVLASKNPIRSLIGGLGLAAVAALGLALSIPDESPSPLADQATWSALVIGPARGQIEPCGCSGGQLGGIDRLSTVLGISAPSFAPSGRPPRFAAGGIVAHEAEAHPAWAQAQAEVLWQAVSALGFDAVGLGSSELDQLASPASRTALPILLGTTQLVASNLVELQGDTQRTPAFLSSHWTGSGVTMLSFLPPDLSGSFGPERTWKTLSPDAALKDLTARGAWAATDPTLAFFEGTAEAAAALAQRLTADSFVLLVGDEFEATERVDDAGAKVIHIGSRLRQSLRLSGGPELEPLHRLQQQRVFEDVPADPAVGFLRGLFRTMLMAYDARGAVAGTEPHPGRGGYAGSTACAGCHEEAYAIWQETLHHQALETLQMDERDGVNATFDPRCVRCHVVGFGSPTGFGSKQQPEATRWRLESPVANVGCESCHGPGKDHITSEAKTDIELGGEYTCLRCHDSENDPDFHFEERWADISHAEGDL